MLRTIVLAFAASAGCALAQFNLDESSNAVGICYSVWHDLAYDGSQPPDIVEITEVGNGNFAGQGAWHWWGRPEGNYYGGGDRAVLGRHFSQLSGAGVDFIAIDATNLVVSFIIVPIESCSDVSREGIRQLCAGSFH